MYTSTNLQDLGRWGKAGRMIRWSKWMTEGKESAETRISSESGWAVIEATAAQRDTYKILSGLKVNLIVIIS